MTIKRIYTADDNTPFENKEECVKRDNGIKLFQTLLSFGFKTQDHTLRDVAFTLAKNPDRFLPIIKSARSKKQKQVA